MDAAKKLSHEDLLYIVINTPNIWRELRHGSIFLTGATGFVGTWLLEALLFANEHLELDLKVTALSRHNRILQGVHWLQGDVRDFEFKKTFYTHVIHAATDTCAKLNLEDPLLMFDTIVRGTQHILEYAQVCRAEHILYLSSGAAQAPENHLADGASYAIGKFSAEHICAMYAKQYAMNIKIARLYAFVGPHLPTDKHYAIGNFIRDALNGGPITITGDGTTVRSYLYAADMVIWLLNILCFGKSLEPYNVGSDVAITIADLAQMVAAQFNPEPMVNIMQPIATGKTDRYVPDVRRTRNEFELPENINLKDSIKKTIQYAKS